MQRSRQLFAGICGGLLLVLLVLPLTGCASWRQPGGVLEDGKTWNERLRPQASEIESRLGSGGSR